MGSAVTRVCSSEPKANMVEHADLRQLKCQGALGFLFCLRQLQVASPRQASKTFLLLYLKRRSVCWTLKNSGRCTWGQVGSESKTEIRTASCCYGKGMKWCVSMTREFREVRMYGFVVLARWLESECTGSGKEPLPTALCPSTICPASRSSTPHRILIRVNPSPTQDRRIPWTAL